MYKNKFIKGQIAIFLALIFVVLFTLFGLAINVSMVVHDKINLQNASDFTAYYVAQKQAEMLNAIAHTNYQIRQSWKLFAFRYRVLGQIGRRGDSATGTPAHPGLGTNPNGLRLNETIYEPAQNRGICVAGSPYFFSPLRVGDYHCRTFSLNIPTIRAGTVLLPGIGGAGTVTGNIPTVNTTILASCEASTYFNWWYGLNIFMAFQQDQKARRAIIRSLAENLSRPIARGGMRDLDGNDVFDGAFKTFQYNLSESNKERDENYQLVIENSLANVDRSRWLPEITIDTVLPAVMFNTSAGGCATSGTMVLSNVDNFIPPQTLPTTVNYKNATDPLNILVGRRIYSSDPTSLDTISLGVEKNPWFMVYNKVTAVTFSKALFTPGIDSGTDGQRGIRISATAYAKPFGGRIGPWYRTQWSQGATRSAGGTKTDQLVPPRTANAAGLFTAGDPTLRPNYSRYPGDQRGLVTNSAMVQVGRLINWGSNGSAGINIRADDLTNPVYSFFDGTPGGDPLAQRLPNTQGNVPAQEAFLRKIETAAVAPDAFDVTHYSIFPGFWDNMGSKLSTWLQPSTADPNHNIRGDLGFLPGAGGRFENYDIMNQLEDSQRATLIPNNAASAINRRLAPWFVRRDGIGGVQSQNGFAFLTGWNSGVDVMDYTTPSNLGNRFANCEPNSDLSRPGTQVRIPGECLRGGRVGYSVKLISGDYLRAEHPIGGEGVTGSIENPL